MIDQASRTAENYLKNIWKIRETGTKATTTSLAEVLRVTPATVTAQVKRLVERGWVRHERYGDVELTDEGRYIALRVLRRHRLWELFLVKVFNFPLHLVDEEAEKMEHILSEELEKRIDAFLDHPKFDPHGHPIPTAEGKLDKLRDRNLAELEVGTKARVARVSDVNPAILEYLTGLGFSLEAEVEVLDKKPFGGPLHVRVADKEEYLGPEAAEFVAVVIEGERK